MKKFAVAASLILASAVSATSALADDPMVTKAPPVAVAPTAPPPPQACTSIAGFFLTDCQLLWYGVRLYGIVDVGGGYQTHGSPFDPNFPTGASYFLNKPSRQAEWIQSPNGMSQSLVGIEVKEAIAPGGWAFVGKGELAFDPYSGLLANAPQALQDAIHVPLNQQEIPVDSSRWGWLAAQIYGGVSHPVYGTLTFGRQNALLTDGVNAYDPQAGAYAFSPIGFSGLTCGAGDTEECRWTTAIKYRVNVGPVRLAIMGQPITGTSAYNAYNPNNGAVEGDIGGDFHLGPGLLSLDGIGSYIVNAVNIGPSGGATNAAGVPVAPFLTNTYLSATLSNQTSFMALAKYSFGSWSSPPPIVGKGPVAPPALVGIPLTLYAGYEWIQFANPSNPVTTSFLDDGFTFNYVSATGGAPPASGNGTTIANNAYNASCGTGSGCSDKIFQVMWVGFRYGITRDLDFVGGYYHYIQDQFVSGTGVCSNPTAHSQCAGTEDMWSTVLDWRFLPKWDAYIGEFFSQVNAGLSNGYLARNNYATTAGVRFRF
jgi:predicted porin